MSALSLRPRAGVLVAAIAVLALVVAGVLAAVEHRDLGREETLGAQRTDASRAASQVVPRLLTYRSDDLAAQTSAARALVTPRFRPELDQLLSRLIEPTVRKGGFATTAEVQRVGVVAQERDSVTVLLFLQQRTQRSGGSLGEPIATRAQVRMVRAGSRWRVDDLRPV